ncbi:hypothetical protein TIFTF001_052618, partial [Ficus carica]
MIEHFGLMPGEGADAPYRDPEIYRDMHHTQYLSFLATWHAYPQESMGHYCRRFQEEMLPYIPQNIDSPEMQALVILRNGLPPQIRQQMLSLQSTRYDAGIGELIYEPGPVLPEDPIPAVPLLEIPAQEAEVEMDADAQDADDLLVAPDDQPEDLLVIDISSDEEEPEPEPELEHAGWLEYEEDFEGPTDPIAADNWLIDIQVILDFMRLTEQEKVLCASFVLKKDARHWWMTVQLRRDVTAMNWQDFVTEFHAMYYNREILAAQQDEFTSLKQGSMTVMEAVKKFEQLARLCPELVPNETEKVRRMMKMFRTDIAKQVGAGSSPPTLVSDCVSRAIRAEYWINQDKEARAQIFKAKKEEKAVVKQAQPRQNAEPNQRGQPSSPAQGSKQFGRNKRKENFTGQ